MSASAAAFPVTKCPPGPERADLHFDQYRFIQPKYAVSAEFKGTDEWDSPGFAFEDYTRCHVQTRKLGAGARLPAPAWAYNDDSLRRLLVAYIEKRADYRKPQPGTDDERLKRAQQVLSAKRAAQIETLGELCKEHAALSKSSPLSDSEKTRKDRLAVQIQNLDTILRIDKDVAAVVIGVVYGFLRRGLDSVAVANELNIKPPHVRQLLWRLRKTWGELTGEFQQRVRRKIDVVLACQLYRDGTSVEAIAARFACTAQTVRRALIRAGVYKPRHVIRPQDSYRRRTLDEHAAILERLAANNGGLLPTYSWLNANGYFFSYEQMRKNPELFAHIKRESARRPRNT